MDFKYDDDIRLDKYGRPDVDYYVNEANRLRALAFRQLIHASAEWFMTHFAKRHELPLRPSH